MEQPAPKSMTKSKSDRWAHRRAEPRTFAAIWALYLLGACIVCVGAAGVLGLMATDVYRPAIRMVMVVAGAGLGVVWPLIRLSQDGPQRPVRDCLVDYFVIQGPLQAIVWPQALPWMAAWPWATIAVLGGTFAVWGLLIAGFLAAYFIWLDANRGGIMSRSMAMCIALAVTLGGPLGAMLAHGDLTPWLLSSPAGAAFEICRDRAWSGASALVMPAHTLALAILGIAGVLVWSVLWVAGRGDRA